MRSAIILLHVGLFILHSQGNWVPGKQYNYELYTETITSQDPSKFELNKNIGLVTKGNLIIQPQNESYLRAQVRNSRYREDFDIPVGETINLGFEKFPILQKSFGIILLKDGIVQSLEIDENVPTWELNYYKSIIGLLQINVTEKSATTFQSTEDSFTGRCQVMYDVTKINEKDVLIAKTKNFSHCDDVTEYHSRSTGNFPFNSDSNKNENLLNRFFTSKTTVTDYWNNPTIIRSEIFSQVTVKLSSKLPDIATFTSELKLSLVTSTGVETELSPVSNTQCIESLHYVRNDPFEHSNSRKESSPSPDSNQKLSEAPSFLLLPYFIGNEGNVVWKDRNEDLINMLKEMTLEIANDLDKNDMIENDGIEKMIILVDLIRTLNIKQIDDVLKSFDIKTGTHEALNVNVFYKAVGLAGTGPALLSVKKWIQENKIDEDEASHAVETLSKNALMPTIEYLDEFFNLITMDNVINSDKLYKTSVLSFSDAIQCFIARDDSKRTSHTVNISRPHSDEDKMAMTAKYLQFFADQLKKSVNEKDSGKISLFTLAIGKTNHWKILSVFKPYIEGDIPLSVHQRTWMILSLSKFAKTWPELARSVLYKIYINILDDYEVRCAAVYLIMQTNPPVSVLQKMADLTKYDRSKHVSAVVYSAILAAAALEGNDQLTRSAKAAIPLLNPRIDITEYSVYIKQNWLYDEDLLDIMVMENRNDVHSIFADLGSGSSVHSQHKQFDLLISDLQNIFTDFISTKKSVNNKFFKFSPENITKMLGLKTEYLKRSEGLLFMEDEYSTLFLTLDDILKTIKNSVDQTNAKGIQNGQNKNYFHRNFDLTLTFPTETGMIFHYTLQHPVVVKTKTSYTLNSEDDSNSVSMLDLKLGIDELITQSSIGRVGFVAPFKNTFYVVGYDEHVQVNIPIHLSFVYKQDEQYLNFKAEPLSKGKAYNLIKKKSIPFVSKINFLELKPVSKNLHTRIIHSKNTLSQRFTEIPGITWDFNASTYEDANESIFKFLLKDDKIRWSSFILKWDTDVDNTQEANLTIFFDLKNSTTNVFTDKMNTTLEADAGKINSEISNDHDQRQKLMNEVLHGLNAGEAIALDIFLDLKWYESINIMANTAFSYSLIDDQVKHLGHYKIKYSDQSLDLCTNIDARSSRKVIFDPKQTIKSTVFMEALGDLHFGLEDCHNAKLKIHGTIHQSESRKSDFLQKAEAKECLSSTKNILLNCAKALELNHLADEEGITFIFDETTDIFQTGMTKGLIQIADLFDDNIQVSRPKKKRDKNKITIMFKIIPKETLRVTISTPDMDFIFKDSKTFLHKDGIIGERDTMMLYRNLDYVNLNLFDSDKCIIDDTKIKTFDGQIYNFTMTKCWQVILTTIPHYINKEPITEEQSRISILMKNSIGDNRDLLIVLGNHKITFFTHDNSLNVEVDDEAVMNSTLFFSQYDNEQNNSLFYIYKSPKQFYRLYSDYHGIDVHFDGKHLQVAENYLQTKILGLCGNFDGDEENELVTPGQCKENEEVFAFSWVLEKDSCEDEDFKRNFNSDLNKICKKNNSFHLSVIDDEGVGS